MERAELDIKITRTGKVTVEVKGLQGQSCLDLADAIKDIVGKEDRRQLTAGALAPDGKVRIDAKVRRSQPH